MKKTIYAFLILLLTVSISYAIPSQINFQGFLKDSTGRPITDPALSMVFSIYAGATGGSALWNETQTVSVEGGLYSVQLGSVTAIGASVFDGTSKYLGIKVGSDSEMTPRVLLVSVPYAFRAGIADSAGPLGDYSVTTTKIATSAVTSEKIAAGSVTPPAIAASAVTKDAIATSNTPATNQYLTWNGAALQWANVIGATSREPDYITIGTNGSGSLEVMNGGISTAKISNEAVTNAKIANSTIDLTQKATYIPLNRAGGTMEANLSLGGNKITNLASPTATLDAANKAYVDAQISGGGSVEPDYITIGKNANGSLEVLNNGITTAKISIEAALDLRGNKIINLAAPAATSDATNKAYVDGQIGGIIPSGTAGQTLRHNGTSWEANSNLYNDGVNIGIGTNSPLTFTHLKVNTSVATTELLIENVAGDAAQRYLSAGVQNISVGIDQDDNNNYKISDTNLLTGTTYTDTNTMLRIHTESSSEGIIDFNHQSRARAHLMGAAGLPMGIWAPITFDTENYDEKNEFAASMFTALEDGYYQVNSRTSFEAEGTPLGDYVSIAIYKNGAIYAQGNRLQISLGAGPLSHNNAPVVSDIVELVKGDTIQIWGFISGAVGGVCTLVKGSSQTYVSIHKIS